MKQKVLITPKSFSRYREEALGILSAYNVEVIENKKNATYTLEEMRELCRDIRGIIVGIDPMDRSVLREAKNLKAISKYGVGLDNIDMDAANEYGIKVSRTAGANSESVAELTVGMFFVLSRNLMFSLNSVRSGGWERTIGTEIRGKTAGIIGLGAIGREVARMCGGLGMKVLGYDPYFSDDEWITANKVTMRGLDDVIRESDFVTLNIPLTDATHHLINKERLQLMKKTAYLINNSRGQLVDEDDLYEALVNQEIAGAAQDVFSQEPAGKHRLLTLDNFLLTPHIGAFTEESTKNMVLMSVNNLTNMLFN